MPPVLRRLLSLRHGTALVVSWGWAGFVIGMGGFQLFDGIVSHKVRGIHQIRYGVNILPYDLVWNLSALVLLGIGLWLWRRAKLNLPSIPLG